MRPEVMRQATWTPPEAPEEVRRWADAQSTWWHWNIDWLVDDQDVPEAVREYARQWMRQREEWLASASERPMTVDPASHAIQLFDGPLVDWEDFQAIGIQKFREGDEEKIAWLPSAYQDAMEAGDVEACRRMAAAFYEAREMRMRIGKMLWDACGEYAEPPEL